MQCFVNPVVVRENVKCCLSLSSIAKHHPMSAMLLDARCWLLPARREGTAQPGCPLQAAAQHRTSGML
jgi:hypothetical protein